MVNSGSLLNQVVTVRIASIGDLLGDLVRRFGDDELIWYRGHARSDWLLQPSLARLKRLSLEKVLWAEFQRDAIPLLARADLQGQPPSEWDWMFLMQHYRVPTRLLDWTESPLTALFFALDDAEVPVPDAEACIWALRPQELNRAARVVSAQPWAVPLCDMDPDAAPYLLSELNIGQRHLPPLAIAAMRRFDRIRAQGGVFTVIHKDATPIEQLGPQLVVKYLIDAAVKFQLRRELSRLGLTASLMYPDLEHLGKRVAERLR